MAEIIESCKYSNVILSTQELKFTVQEGYSLPLDQIIGLERAVPTDLSPTWEAFSRARWISYNPKFCHKYDAVPNQIQVNIMENMAVGKYQDIITLGASNGVAILPSPVVSIVLEVQPKPPPVKPLKIITATLPDGEVGKAYECQIEAEGGVPPYIWSCAGLPDGLITDSQTGQITGTPISSGFFPVKARVQDSEIPAVGYTADYAINIPEPPTPPVKIVIMSPKGGEVWYENDTEDITWVAENAGDETLDIHLILDGVASVIATNVPVKSLGYLWTISGIPVSENVVIELVTNYQTVQCPPFAIRERTGCAIPWPLAKVLKKVRKPKVFFTLLFARVHHITITPTSASIEKGKSQSYRVQAYRTATQLIGDVTAKTTFSVSPGAGGSWIGAVYTSGNEGQWVIIARYANKVATSQLVVQSVPSFICPYCGDTFSTEAELTAHIAAAHAEPPLPTLIYGKLVDNVRVAQYDDMSVLLYRTWSPATVHAVINSREGTFDYPVPNAPNMHLWPVAAVLASRTDLYIYWHSQQGLNLVNQYMITGQGLSYISQVILGDADSRLCDFIRLRSGKLLAAWHQWETASSSEGKYIGFAYTDSIGQWHTLPLVWVPRITVPAGNAAMRGQLVQDTDGSIWFFFIRDSFARLYSIKLVEVGDSIEVANVYNPLLDRNDHDPITPDGEYPLILTWPAQDGVYVAYQRTKDRVMHFPETGCAFSFIDVIKVLPASCSLIMVSTGRAERVQPFAAGPRWLAYGRFNEPALTWNELVLETPGLTTTLGKLYAGSGTTNNQVFIYGSRYWVAAQMSDNYIHFFKV